MKILITGGNGFLGSHIAQQLVEKGHNVVSLQRSDPVVIQKIANVDYAQGDLCEKDSILEYFEGVEVVFHVAAFAGVWGPWEEFYASNYEGSVNVVEACRAHGVKKLIFTSTPSVVFSGNAICGEDESMPYGSNWLCHYAHTKQLAEAYVLSDEVAKDMDVVALRPHLIWGAGDPHLLPRLVDRARDGELKMVGDGKNRVDITHISNATNAHMLAFEKLINSPQIIKQKAYFVSDGEPVVLWDWIQSLLEDLGIPKIEKQLSFKLVFRMASLIEWWYRTFKTKGEPPMTRFVAVELSKDHYFDISAARETLGYNPECKKSNRTELLDYLREL